MSPRTFLVGLFALICGVSASVGVNRMRNSTPVAKAETVKVPVAAVNIKRGEEVTNSMIVDREWPKDMVPSGVIVKRDQIVGKMATTPLVKGEPVFSGKVGVSPRFSGLVKEGMRAYTILTPNDSSLVAGLVEPGDKVDVLFTDSTNNAMTGGGTTAPIMQNIEVMAIGQIIDPSESRANTGRKMRSVTLAVPLEMAAVLALAQEMGTLHLALRSERDEATAGVTAVTMRELLHTARPALFEPQLDASQQHEAIQTTAAKPVAAPEPEQPSQIAVRTLRGTIRSTMLMRVAGGKGSIYIEGNPLDGSLPMEGQVP